MSIFTQYKCRQDVDFMLVKLLNVVNLNLFNIDLEKGDVRELVAYVH